MDPFVKTERVEPIAFNTLAMKDGAFNKYKGEHLPARGRIQVEKACLLVLVATHGCFSTLK
jgi:hypothetical protein